MVTWGGTPSKLRRVAGKMARTIDTQFIELQLKGMRHIQTNLNPTQYLASDKLGLLRTGISMFPGSSSLTLLTHSDVLAIRRTQSICSDETEKETASPRVCGGGQ